MNALTAIERPLHRKVPGQRWGYTSACGLFVGIETVNAINGTRFALEPRDAVTCVACLLATDLKESK